MRPGFDRPVMWDVVSDAPMSTQHANARFFVPMLAKEGWALFVDGDVMFRSNVCRLFDKLDPAKAVYCVHHRHAPNSTVKMDGQTQTQYKRKNWSSVILFNCDHPANKALTLDVLNNTPGRDLHALFWLSDCDIGELDAGWNWLAGHSDPQIEPDIVHFTDGVPNMAGYENVPYADEWHKWRKAWAR
jgi:lipopolysaccharide biosynthesis glycosyltransferase